jgi:hypothetical protein
MTHHLTPGIHKFILAIDTDDQMVIISKNLRDHEDIANSEKSMKKIIGGGWLAFRPQSNWMRISGKSGKYGKADHELVRKLLKQDPRFFDFKIRIEQN